MERFAELLATEKVEVCTGSSVRRVVRDGANLRVELANGMRRFDRVVVTLAAPLAARVCPQLTEDERQRLEGVRYLGIVCASLLLTHPLAAYYVTNLTDEGFPFTGVIEMSTLVDPVKYLSGLHLVYLPRYVTPEDSFFDLPDAEVEARFLDGLERIYPGFRRSSVRAFRLSRVRQVCALPTLRYSDRLPPRRTSVPGLWLAGSAHIVNGTLNVNETVELAEQTFREMMSGESAKGRRS
jgi:protoporphyrinogen oxidase